MGYYLFCTKIAVKKSCSDTREKCVFMEKARVIAMDSENPLKLTTEGKIKLYKVYYRYTLYILCSCTNFYYKFKHEV